MNTSGIMKFRLSVMVNGNVERSFYSNKLYHLNKVIDSKVIMPPELNINYYKLFVNISRPIFQPFSLFMNS